MFTYIVLVTIFIGLFYQHIKNKKRIELGNKFPGPAALPIIGNLLLLINRKPEDVMEYLEKWHSEYGSIYRVWVGTKLAFMVSDPTKMEIVLSNSTKHLTKNDLYNFLIPWLGEGLLLSRGRKWHNRRKIITPAFHFKILEQFVEIFDRQSITLIDKLSETNNANGQVFNIQPFITLFALDVVCETAMGTKINAQTDSQSEYVKAVHDISNVIASRFAAVWQRSGFLFKTFGYSQYKKQLAAIEILHNFTEKIIDKRRKQLINEINLKAINNVSTNEENDLGINKKMALLDILLQSNINGKALTNNDIREEVDTFMFEGHDTTTSGICFTLYLISRHDNVQQKLYDEIIEIIGSDKNKLITYRDLQDLKYMELVIKESLRLYPPVPIIGRFLEEDTVIDHRIIPANTNFTMNFYRMFRDPNFFPNPNDFDPMRFNTMENNTMEQLNPYTYIPFSAGSRNCIGQKFAVLEMKSTISKILRNFQLLPCGDPPKLTPELVLRSLNGIQLGIVKRK